MAESTWASTEFQTWAKKNNYILAKTDLEKTPELREKYNIVGTPTVLVYNPKGEVVDRTLGFIRPTEFIATVDDYQKGIGTLGSMLAEERSKMTDTKFMYKLGERLLSWNRVDEADGRFAAIDALDPENKNGDADDALMERSWICRKKEKWDCAVSFAQDCYKRWPEGEMASDAFVTAAWYMVKGGHKAEGMAGLKEYVQKWPKGGDAEWAQEQIAKIEKELAAPDSTKTP